MEPIRLTEKQKEKLIEMCNKLFPAERFLLWEVPKWNLDLFSQKQQLKIHWYEFCMTYLCSKIGNSKRSDLERYFDESDIRHEMVTRQEWYKGYHPVDFLYKEFKKIKK